MIFKNQKSGWMSSKCQESQILTWSGESQKPAQLYQKAWKLLAIVTSWSRDEGWAAKIEKLVGNY